MTGGETQRHRRLKALALAWAQANGWSTAATEVRIPRSGYRSDVAACAGTTEAGGPERTAVFECKQARPDLLKDAHGEAATRARLAELTERRRTLEELFRVHRPELRCGEALWPEYDRWDFSGLRHGPYRAVLAELATVRRRVRQGTKFAKMFRYRCADRLYLVTEDDIFAEAEIPAGWGLLVRRETAAGGALEVRREPVEQESAPEQRRALGEAIAEAGRRRSGKRRCGV